MKNMNNIVLLIGRIFLALLFLVMGLYKVGAAEFAISVMASVGLPAFLFPLVLLLEIGGGLMLIFGWKTKIVALVLSLFSIATAILFHNNLNDLNEMVNSLKNISVAGGMLYLFLFGPGDISIDHKLHHSKI